MKKLRGFAAMDPERRREVSRLGGSSVPKEKRSFSADHALARSAGALGGKQSAKIRKQPKEG